MHMNHLERSNKTRLKIRKTFWFEEQENVRHIVFSAESFQLEASNVSSGLIVTTLIVARAGSGPQETEPYKHLLPPPLPERLEAFFFLCGSDGGGEKKLNQLWTVQHLVPDNKADAPLLAIWTGHTHTHTHTHTRTERGRPTYYLHKTGSDCKLSSCLCIVHGENQWISRLLYGFGQHCISKQTVILKKSINKSCIVPNFYKMRSCT